MHSMSGSAAAGGDHGGGQLYRDHQPATAGSVPLYHGDDVADSVFFQSRPACGGGDDGGLTPSYYSITEYLQGFLDPTGPPCFPTGGAAVKRESAVGDVISGAAAPVTHNWSTSSEPAVAEEKGELRDHQNCRSDTKEKRKKGTGEKKARRSRVAFATKSEVDHLDDGYRWRKYGQKAVKSSSFPRSYYRCTVARCGVKKQVERSHQDPSTVVTTYEGRHAHPSLVDVYRGPRTIMAAGAYSLPALQHQRHGLCLAGADVYGRMCTPPTSAASAVASLPHQAERRLAEYCGMQLQDLLPDAVIGYHHGHR